MRDFYDIHILQQIYGNSVPPSVLHNALEATSKKRGTLEQVKDADAVFDEVEKDQEMEKLWRSYQKNFSYAEGLSWHMMMDSIRILYALGEQDNKIIID